MKAYEKDFLRFLEGSDKNFIIPVYQRNYDWKKEQCKQLFEDLLEIRRRNFRKHFFGSIVSLYDPNGRNGDYLIIDGQQRITTVSILLIAIHNLIRDKIIYSDKINIDQIKDTYLINKYENQERKVRLKPIKSDKPAFDRLLEKGKKLVINSNITNNYMFFCGKLKENRKVIDEIYEAIKRLLIVEIELNAEHDDPQLIFESLNSTGLDLKEADKVRNFILMSQNKEKQERFYEEYWNNIEKNTDYEVSDFIRDYLTMKDKRIPNMTKVYFEFKTHVKNQDRDIEEILKDMLKFSEIYSQLLSETFEDRKINETIKRLNKLKLRVAYPFFMEIIDDFNSKELDIKEVEEIFRIVESYIFRRSVCGVTTNSLNKIFQNLCKDIKKADNYKENYFKIFKSILLNKKFTQRFPDDEEFSEIFVKKDVYNFKNREYLLEMLENYDNKESVRGDELTVEHIMPQKLDEKEWKKSLGENWEEVHQKYLHTIGNLTLTGYNSKYSNKSFSQKKSMENGFDESRLYLNSFLKKTDTWNEKKIKERAGLLMERALKIWQIPEDELKVSERNTFTLDEEELSFVGKKIKEAVIFSREYTVKDWKDFMEKIIRELYERNTEGFTDIINRKFKNRKYKNKFSGSPDNLKRPIEISESFYVESNMNTDKKLELLRLMFSEFDINPEEVEFSLKD